MPRHPRPIFIIGSPRSGTTLLGKLLAAHPDLAYAEEPRLVWRQGNDGRSDYLRPEHARPGVVRGIHDTFDRLVERGGKTRLLEKTPSNALRLDFMRTVYPDGVFVHVLRNAYDAVLSIRTYSQQHRTGVPKAAALKRLKEIRPGQIPHYAREAAARVLPQKLNVFGRRPAWGPRLPGMDRLTDELDPLALASLQWRGCVEAACQAGRAFPAGQYLEVRLEDLSADLLQRVTDFCGLSDSEEVAAAFRKHFRPADPTGRRSAADPTDLETIRRWTEPTLAWLGYPTALPAPSPAASSAAATGVSA